MKDELAIGRIRTAHGVRGELKVDTLSGETEHFRDLEQVTLVRGSERTQMRVESVRVAHRTVLLKLEGIDSPEEGKRWRGWELVAKRARAAALGEDEFYYADLIGLRVVFESSERGYVANVWEGGRTVLLGIAAGGGAEEHLVPFQAEFVVSVDLDRGVLELSTDEVLE